MEPPCGAPMPAPEVGAMPSPAPVGSGTPLPDAPAASALTPAQDEHGAPLLDIPTMPHDDVGAPMHGVPMMPMLDVLGAHMVVPLTGVPTSPMKISVTPRAITRSEARRLQLELWQGLLSTHLDIATHNMAFTIYKHWKNLRITKWRQL